MSIVIMKALMGFHEEWKFILYNLVGFPSIAPTSCSFVWYNGYWKECGWNIMATTGAKEGER